MANGERLEVVKGKLFCSSKVISGKLYILHRFASGIKLWHTIVKKVPSSSVYERWQNGGEWKMEQKQPPNHRWQKQNKDWYSKLKGKRPWQKQLRRSINFRSCWNDALYSGVCLCLWVCVSVWKPHKLCPCNSPHVSDTVFPPRSLWDTGSVSCPHP